jgi:maltokinase
MAMLQPYLHNATDGWALAITSLRDLYAEADESDAEDDTAIRELVDEQGSDFTPDAARLGTVIAEMHLALAGDSMPEAMRAEPAGPAELGAWAEEMLADLATLDNAGEARVASLRDRIEAVRGLPQAGLAIRVHGDLHLGQTARTDVGWIILDFEGEPSRSVEARRRRASALRDVAGVMRSFDYASAVALLDWTTPDDPRWERLQRFGDTWTRVNQEAFWDAYVATVGGSPLLPPAEMVPVLLDGYMVQKALYELSYELNHRPQWAWIPMRYLEAPT